MCLGLYLSAVHLLPALDVPVGRCLCASRVVFFLGAAGLLPFCCCSWVLAVWPSLFWLPPLPSPLVVFWCFLVQSVLLVPPSGYLVVFATGRLSYLWHGVSWLLARVFPPLHGNKASALCGTLPSPPCCGCCSCALRLRHWGIRPRVIQNPLRTLLKLYAPTLACAAFSLLPLLPSRASALSLFAGLRLPSSPRALLWLVLSARLVVRCPGWCFWLPLLRGFGLVCWRGLVFVWLGLSGFSVCWLVSGCFLFFASCVCWLRPTSVWTGTFVYFAFTCTTKALIDHCTCVSVRRLDGFTCTVEFHRSTTSYFNWFCVTIRWVLRWLRMADDCRPQQYTHTATLISSLSPLSVGGWLVS